MTTFIRIEDISDPRLDDYRGMRDPARRSRSEPEGGFFVAEGVFVIERLLGSSLQPRSLLLTEAKAKRLEPALQQVSAPVYLVDRDQMHGIVGFDLHRGALASANRPGEPGTDVLDGLGSVCILEGLNDHENLGAVLRSAVALGVEAVILDPTCADPWYRRSVRVSMGAVFDVPIVRDADWPRSLSALSSLGFRVVAMTVGEHAVPITEVDAGGPTAVMLGAEGAGLSDGAVALADVEVSIPIAEGIDSLNVGHAAAIAFHHFCVRP